MESYVIDLESKIEKLEEQKKQFIKEIEKLREENFEQRQRNEKQLSSLGTYIKNLENKVRRYEEEFGLLPEEHHFEHEDLREIKLMEDRKRNEKDLERRFRMSYYSDEQAIKDANEIINKKFADYDDEVKESIILEKLKQYKNLREGIPISPFDLY